MLETATSLQDVRLHRESHKPALPPDWISAVTRGGKGKGIFKCCEMIYVQFSHWFIFFV